MTASYPKLTFHLYCLNPKKKKSVHKVINVNINFILNTHLYTIEQVS